MACRWQRQVYNSEILTTELEVKECVGESDRYSQYFSTYAYASNNRGKDALRIGPHNHTACECAGKLLLPVSAEQWLTQTDGCSLEFMEEQLCFVWKKC